MFSCIRNVNFWEIIIVELIIADNLWYFFFVCASKSESKSFRWNVLNFIAYLSALTPTHKKYIHPEMKYTEHSNAMEKFSSWFHMQK